MDTRSVLTIGSIRERRLLCRTDRKRATPPSRHFAIAMATRRACRDMAVARMVSMLTEEEKSEAKTF